MTYQVFDTTLRDGAQREGISFSVVDKLAVARLLDEFGVGFIEGGWPGAMPKDTEFFRRARTELNLKHATLVAFGATRKAGVDVAEDPQVQALLDSEAPVVCLVAKSDIRHVERALRTTGDEKNLAMVRDSVAHFVANGRRVFLDCEHFFDGFRFDPDYTSSVVRAALDAGAERVVMCDTNGGMVPSRITAAISELTEKLGITADLLGIHCQNDTSCAVANTIAAVEAGVKHFQCTANGYGERPGNADLFAVVGNLQLKLGLPVLPDGCLEKAMRVSHGIAEIANIAPDTHQPTSGPRHSLTRRGCTRARSKLTRCSTTTSTRPWSATTCASWSPRWPAGPASSSRHASSVWTWPASRRRCPGSPSGSRSWRRTAGASRPRTPRSSCWSAPNCPETSRSSRSGWSPTG